MKRIYDCTILQDCYEAGYDAGLNGGNRNNSDYTFFTSPDRTKAWERGNKDSKKKMKKSNQNNSQETKSAELSELVTKPDSSPDTQSPQNKSGSGNPTSVSLPMSYDAKGRRQIEDNNQSKSKEKIKCTHKIQNEITKT